MAYTNFGRDGGSTLTEDERSAEAERILRRFKDVDLEHMESDGVLTAKAAGFLQDRLDEWEVMGRVRVSASQLFWLRDLNEKV